MRPTRALAFAGLCALAASAPFATPARADLRIVATVPDLAAVARDIGGAHATVKALVLSTQDPHFVDPRPSLALDLNRADLLLTVGLGLEIGWLPTLQTGARNGRIQTGGRGHLDCSQFVGLLEVPRTAVDRSMGDVHPGGNPHYWYDPRAMARVAAGIAARMAELDPARAGDYQANLKTVLARLGAARVRWEARLAGVRGLPIVGYHKTWVYLADWLGFEEVEFLEPKPGIPPNPHHVAEVLAIARRRQARAIFQEEYYPDATSRLLAQKIPTPLVRLPGGTRFERGQSYVDHVEEMVTLIERALRPEGGR